MHSFHCTGKYELIINYQIISAIPNHLLLKARQVVSVTVVTQGELFKYGIKPDDKCCFCGEKDSIDPTFIHCSFTKSAFHLSELTGPGELVRKGSGQSTRLRALHDLFAWAIACLSKCKRTNMADVLSFLIVCEFFWCGEEEVAMENEIEEDVVFFSAIRLFMRREISRIRCYFEVTVPVYELDVFRSPFV